MTKKIALITGISGQDGAYLAKFLIKKKYKVIGLERRSARSNNWRLEKLKIDKKVIIEDIDLKELNNLIRVFSKYKIDEVYNLAAQSFVYSSFQNPIETSLTNSIGVLNLLEIIRNQKKKIKFYQASTSEMIGNTKSKLQNENAEFYPRSPYACAKVFAHYITKNYREAYGIFACSGILFNHESPIRGEEVVTRKITKQFSEIKIGKRNILELGNLNAKRDWGHAQDYVEAMWKMLQQKKPLDFVIGTGETHSVKEFCRIAFESVGLNYKKYVQINKKFYRPAEVDLLIADYSFAKKVLKWKPTYTFKNLVLEMVQSDLQKFK